MNWIWSSDWREFFGQDPYPFDLALVEARDGSDRESLLIRQVAGPPPGSLIDLGCGYGRHIVALGKAGYRIVGADISPRCVARAARRPGTHEAVVATHQSLPFKDGAFDGAFSVYSSVGYPGTSTQRMLAEAHRVTRPGGWLVIDVRHQGRGTLSCGWEKVPRGYAVWVNFAGDRWIRQRNWVVSRRVIGQYGFNIERHTVSTLLGHADRAGWDVQGVYGDYSLSSPYAGSQRLVMVACRPS